MLDARTDIALATGLREMDVSGRSCPTAVTALTHGLIIRRIP
jgi:hypothetical protein